ncbi:MAG: phage tail tape measure protein [Caldilineaceae bacterium]|nr:phage tail tape measure protein [Caldilineaceae bacterium]
MAEQIASLYAKIGADTGQFDRAMRGVGKDLQTGGKQATAFGKFFKAGVIGGFVAASGAAVAFGVALKGAVDDAADMEQQLADISSVMGTTADETAQLGQLIQSLGLDPNLKVDAVQAADAIEMLGRNGLTMTQIMDGAARSTVLLANATGADFGTAANIATDAMDIFNIEAGNMATAVNGISAIVTSSKFSMDDYALALAQGGGVADAVGVEFDDFNASIAAIFAVVFQRQRRGYII